MKRLMLKLGIAIFLLLALVVAVVLLAGCSCNSVAAAASEIMPEAKVKAVQSLTKKIAAQKATYKKMFDVWKKASPQMKSRIAKRLTSMKSGMDGLQKQINVTKMTKLQEMRRKVRGIAGTVVATGKKQIQAVKGAAALLLKLTRDSF